MPTEANSLDDPADAAAMRQHADALADALVAHLPAWIERLVLERAAPSGVDEAAARAAASDAAAGAVEVGEPLLRDLLGADIDAQSSTPLAVLRSLVRFPNDALDALGVSPTPRAGFDTQAFPADTHGLSPASFAEVHPDLHEPGIVWGAAKAHIHLRRHKR